MLGQYISYREDVSAVAESMTGMTSVASQLVTKIYEAEQIDADFDSRQFDADIRNLDMLFLASDKRITEAEPCIEDVMRLVKIYARNSLQDTAFDGTPPLPPSEYIQRKIRDVQYITRRWESISKDPRSFLGIVSPAKEFDRCARP